MKLVSLNTWGGTLKEELLSFLKAHSDVDIFCFQEIHTHPSDRYQYNHIPDSFILDRIREVLPAHTVYFSPHLEDWFGVAIFIKKELLIIEKDEEFIFHEKGYIPESDFRLNAKLVQGVRVGIDSKDFAFFNMHGAWQPEGKIDTPDRIEQSERILGFMNRFGIPEIICGDFNALPNTRSILMFEEKGYRNLIKEFNITSTRSSIYTKSDKFADYIFVLPNVKVIDFKVLSDEVSDHSPLFLEFEII